MKLNKVKLGELISIQQGFAFKSKNYVEKSEYRLVTLGNFESNGNKFKPNNKDAKYYEGEFPKEAVLKEGDLVLPLTEQTPGLLGNSAFIPRSDGYTYVLNQRVGKIICQSKIADKYYIHFLLNTELVKKQLEAVAHGTRQHNISPEDIYDLTVFVPSLFEQQKIGSFLYKFEQMEMLNNAISEKLESMGEAIYNYWFLQFEFPDKDGKPYKSNGGKMVWNDQLKQEIPEGWGFQDIKSSCKIIDCLHSKKPSYKFESNDAYLLTLENIGQSNLIDDSKRYYISLDDYKKWTSRIEVHNGDFVITNAGRTGDIARVPLGVKAAIGRNLTAVRPEKISSYYLQMYFKSSYTKQQILANLDSGAFFKSFNVKSIKKLKIVVPDSYTMDLFIKCFSPILDKIEKNMQENQQLKSLRNFLLPLLMNGQVVIND